VREGVGLPAVWTDLKQQIYIGSDQFIESMLKKVSQDKEGVDDVPLVQRQMVPKTLEEYREQGNVETNQLESHLVTDGI
jgi:putative transposase